MSSPQYVELPFDVYQKLQILGSRVGLANPADVVVNMVNQKILEENGVGPEETYAPVTKKGGARHEELKLIAKEYLKAEYGFKDQQVFFEYRVPGGWVDVAGVRSDKRVAVEVGSAPIYRLLSLYEHFNQVIWIPYWLSVVTGNDDLEDEVQRRVDKALQDERRKARFDRQEIELELEGKLNPVAKEILAMVLVECTDRDLKVKLGKLVKERWRGHTFSPSNFKRRGKEDQP